MTILLICLAVGAAGARAQAPATPPEPAADDAAPRAAVSAEHLFQPGRLALSIAAGGAAFTDFQRAWAHPESDAGMFQRRVSAGTTGALGADLLWWVRGGLGLRLHGSFIPTRFAVKHDEAGEEWLRHRAGSPQSPDYARLRIWLADVSAVLRPPFTFGRVAPYALVGGGLVSYQPVSTRTLPPEAEAAFDSGSRTGGAAMLGVGAAVPLQRGNLLLSFNLTDHITRTPLADLGEAVPLRDPRAGLSLAADEERGRVELTNNLRLMVGLTIPLR